MDFNAQVIEEMKRKFGGLVDGVRLESVASANENETLDLPEMEQASTEGVYVEYLSVDGRERPEEDLPKHLPNIPRVGDIIELASERRAEVVGVVYKYTSFGPARIILEIVGQKLSNVM